MKFVRLFVATALSTLLYFVAVTATSAMEGMITGPEHSAIKQARRRADRCCFC